MSLITPMLRRLEGQAERGVERGALVAWSLRRRSMRCYVDSENASRRGQTSTKRQSALNGKSEQVVESVGA